MLNVYKVEGKTDRVLLDIDIHVFACMMAAFGDSSMNVIVEMLERWDFSGAEARVVYNKCFDDRNHGLQSKYGEAKQSCIELLENHLESTSGRF